MAQKKPKHLNKALQPSYVNVKVKISATLIEQGIPKGLKFGRKRNLDSITIGAMDKTCSEEFESAEFIEIRDGEILESECTKFNLLVLSTYKDHTTNPPEIIMQNISMLISKYG